MSDVRDVFNQWALTPRAEKMALGHMHMLNGILGNIQPGEDDRVLDIGCGVGEALRIIGETYHLPSEQLAGIDIAESMVEKAKALTHGDIRVSSAESLPWPQGFFRYVISIESLYYHEDVEQSLAETCRVIEPGGSYHCAIEFFADNRGSRHWPEALGLDLVNRSESEWIEALKEAGFQKATASRVHSGKSADPAKFEASAYYPTFEDYQTFVQEGALYLIAEK